MTINTKSTYSLIYISFFSALTVIGAFIKLPFFIVPITLQTFFVILSGNLLGPKHGAISQIIYIVLGLIGLPVFANGGGIGYILQPTFGYLLAYPLGAFCAGKLIRTISKNKFIFTKIFISNLISILPIFIIGVVYLYLNLNFVVGNNIGFYNVCWTGFIIFIPGDLMKIFLATVVTIRTKKYFNIN